MGCTSSTELHPNPPATKQHNNNKTNIPSTKNQPVSSLKTVDVSSVMNTSTILRVRLFVAFYVIPFYGNGILIVFLFFVANVLFIKLFYFPNLHFFPLCAFIVSQSFWCILILMCTVRMHPKRKQEKSRRRNNNNNNRNKKPSPHRLDNHIHHPPQRRRSKRRLLMYHPHP